MATEYRITVRAALDLWDCLASMRIDNSDISVLTLPQWDTIRNKFEFVVKGGKSQRHYADYDTICMITLKDYTRDIGIFVKRQARIEAAILLWKNAQYVDDYVAKKKLEWELERRNIESSLESTRPIQTDEED